MEKLYDHKSSTLTVKYWDWASWSSCFFANRTGASIHTVIDYCSYWKKLELSNELGHSRDEFHLNSQEIKPKEKIKVDTDPKHTAKLTQEFALQSLKNLGKILKLRLHQKDSGNLRELNIICKDKWDKTTMLQKANNVLL